MTLTRLVLFSGWGIDARIWQPLIACLHARLAHITETDEQADKQADKQAADEARSRAGASRPCLASHGAKLHRTGRS